MNEFKFEIEDYKDWVDAEFSEKELKMLVSITEAIGQAATMSDEITEEEFLDYMQDDIQKVAEKFEMGLRNANAILKVLESKKENKDGLPKS